MDKKMKEKIIRALWENNLPPYAVEFENTAPDIEMWTSYYKVAEVISKVYREWDGYSIDFYGGFYYWLKRGEQEYVSIRLKSEVYEKMAALGDRLTAERKRDIGFSELVNELIDFYNPERAARVKPPHTFSYRGKAMEGSGECRLHCRRRLL